MTDYVDNSNDITVLSLCTGYGGLELGLHRALGRPLRVVAVEIEAFAAANLVAKAEEGKLAVEALYPDIKTFPAERFSGCFDFILAGYPCQPFSVAGKRKGGADDRYLWPFIKDCVQQIRPVWCFFENVAGHLHLGFDTVVADLDGLGYTVEAGLFSAADCGAPHKRERLFILGHSASERPCGGKPYTNRQQSKMFRERLESELGDPQSQRCRETGTDCQRPAQRAASTDTVADTESTERQRTSDTRAGRDGFANEGPRMADASSAGQQKRRPSSVLECTEPVICTSWPARPGQQQYEWEEPRTVESSMGRTVDGFRSRVDELRLLGNGVVPAQAELAFRTLYALFETAKGGEG